MTHSTPGINYVDRPDQIPGVLSGLEDAEFAAIDLETTSLSPRHGHIRLLSISTEAGTWVVDAYRVELEPILVALRSKVLIGHNLLFDLGFLMHIGFEPGPSGMRDTMLMSQLLHAGDGSRHNLAAVADRCLGIKLEKELQKSDWSGTLTEDQIAYSARDTAVLLPLYQVLAEQIHEARMDRVMQIEHDCLPALTWMTCAGVPIDVAGWKAIADRVQSELAGITREMDEIAPPRSGAQMVLPGMDAPGWLWSSPQETLAALRAAGIELTGTGDYELSTADHPLARLIRKHRAASKLLTSYGPGWLESVEDGRVYPHWRQIGAASGRMSCDAPAMQQIPRGEHRMCIKAIPGKALVKADYSQIELRIAARVADDPNMIRAYREGQDLHILTAQLVLGKDEVSKGDRQLAKAVNFGLLYGMGPAGFRSYASAQYGVDITLEQAVQYHSLFFERYPGLKAWHRSVRDRRDAESRTLAGRRKVFTPDTSLPVRLNTPVQGTGADGLKEALGLLWKRRSECPGAVPVIACHDEIVLECPVEMAREAADWLVKAMRDGMDPLIAPVESDVEVQIGESWGG